ncbi:sulfatase [Cognataquiflexum rubidum]|uniref:sulfatase n=1 Tax=Cognataquiflexum rubidum TaxID=2922273 RepID=UPI001F145A8F|nr:sulfatase [Cognataquiflexum rubidum]MCH6232975.1 sulfatase [Cognataquiflexum rubidum]
MLSSFFQNRHLKAFLLFLVMVLSMRAVCFAQKAKEEFNIILIHVDDLGWADIGLLGSDFYETPNIDRLAAEGILFTNSYAAAAICSPTRAALLTGKYPARTGITDWIRAKFQGGSEMALPSDYEENQGKEWRTPKNQGFLPLEEITLAERLLRYGYTNLHIGKWHLGEEGHFPEDQGFHINIGGNDLGQPPSYFDPYLPEKPIENYHLNNLPARKTGEFLIDREGDEVVAFIQNQRDKKFFIHWAPYAVHTPIMGKAEIIAKYQQKEKGKQGNPVYAALVESLDQNVGKVMAELDRLGLRDNTLVIFTSDNGGLIGNPTQPITDNSPLRSQKGYPYEGGIRVPTIVRWPGKIAAGQVNKNPIITMDWIPTILGYLGEESNIEALDGVSLVSAFCNPDQTIPRDLFWHFPHYRGADVVPYAIVRSKDFKLIHYFDGSKSELFDLKNDPGESLNRIDSDPATAGFLLKKLEKWLEETNARVPIKAG